MPAISAIPLAWSLMGTLSIDCQPSGNGGAATTIPYLVTKENLAKMLIAIARIGIMTDLYPIAGLKIALVAAPVRQESKSS
jgi:hypothetical protein